MNVLRSILLTTTILSIGLSAAQAGVVIGGTRVIFDGNKKEASIGINNPDKTPYLIQSWIETPGGGAEKVPFIITPPLYRLNNGNKTSSALLPPKHYLRIKRAYFGLI